MDQNISLKDKIAVMQEYLDGSSVEQLVMGMWVPCAYPTWNWAGAQYRTVDKNKYRIKIKSEGYDILPPNSNQPLDIGNIHIREYAENLCNELNKLLKKESKNES